MTQSDLLKSIRQYFWQQKFVEIEIPYLNSSLPLEPNIYAFKTIWTHKNKEFYLPTSPELALKKFISENQCNCFAISHCFRDLEDSNSLHTPEFLMLEWYEINKNLNDLKKSVKKFINKYLACDFIDYLLPDNLPDNEPDFNQFFLNQIEPNLPKNKAVFITGYPAFLSPLAQIKQPKLNVFSARSERAGKAKPEGSEDCKKYLTSERFELYINGVEIANGCEENTDAQSITKSFIKENQNRLSNNLPTHPISPEFANISQRLPPCSGIGLGIDRLLTIICQNQT